MACDWPEYECTECVCGVHYDAQIEEELAEHEGCTE